jgi:hypothetical protein
MNSFQGLGPSPSMMEIQANKTYDRACGEHGKEDNFIHVSETL